MFKIKIIFSDHAKVKITQRKISRDYIIQTISSPDFIDYNPSGRDRYYKKFVRLHLKVVAKKLKAKIIVITVHCVVKAPNKE